MFKKKDFFCLNLLFLLQKGWLPLYTICMNFAAAQALAILLCRAFNSCQWEREQFGLFSELSAHLKQRDHLRGSVFDVFDVCCRRNPFEGKCGAHCCPLVIHVSGFYTLSACICVLLTLHLA